jgi:hypothetical protein
MALRRESLSARGLNAILEDCFSDYHLTAMRMPLLLNPFSPSPAAKSCLNALKIGFC